MGDENTPLKLRWNHPGLPTSMTKSRKAAMPPRTLAADTKLSAGGAFALNACFVAGLLVLSQLSSLQQRATVRTSIIVAALLLLAWADYELLLRGSKGPFADRQPAKLYARACDQGWPDACGIQ